MNSLLTKEEQVRMAGGKEAKEGQRRGMELFDENNGMSFAAESSAGADNPPQSIIQAEPFKFNKINKINFISFSFA